jgi:hypothetical protein
MVRFDKLNRRITIDCWPYLVEPAGPKSNQFPGWPVVVDQMANYGRRAVAKLPTFRFSENDRPVVQVVDGGGEIVYTLRPAGSEFQPSVFALGRYTVRVMDDRGGIREWKALEAAAENTSTIDVG